MTGLFLRMLAISVSSGAIILLLLFFSARISRRYEAKWRYLLWIAIAVRLVLPVQMQLPFGRLDIRIPAQMESRIRFGKEHAPRISANGKKAAENGQTAGNAFKTMVQTGADAGNHAQENDDRATMASAALAADNAAPAESDAGQCTILELAAVLWLAGALIFGGIHIGSYLHYRKRLLQSAAAQDADDVSFGRRVSAVLEELRIKRPVRILRSADAESPMLIGFRKPILVLPDTDYADKELFYIVKHECVHLKRGDVCVKLLLVTANALHWFNPLVWLMRREAEADMESSCDDKVMQKADAKERRDYAEMLYASVSRRQEKKSCAAVRFCSNKKRMKRRFANILRKPSAKGGLPLCVCAVLAVLLSGMLTACSVQKPAPERETVKEYYRTDRFGEHLVRRETSRDGASEVEVLAVWDEENAFWSYVVTGGVLYDSESGAYIALCEQGSAAGTTVFGIFRSQSENLDEWEKLSELRASGRIESFVRERDGIVCHLIGGTGIYESTYLSRDDGATWELLPGEPDV